MRTIPRWWFPLAVGFYKVRSIWRRVRVSRAFTALLGPQYRRSRDLLEIDITYACNLRCLNCNRSVRQAPEALHMPVPMLRSWVDEWISRGKRWRRIRVLGGEPTLHPQFSEIMGELLRYRAWSTNTRLEVVTNGHGGQVEAQLRRLPASVWVENSRKTDAVQPTFGPFNLAPIDDPRWRRADFANACAIASDCGMGLTPMGYYPCAIAGGIDRITGEATGRQSLPGDEDDMVGTTSRFCRLCGRFRDGHYVPPAVRPVLLEETMSVSWRRAYAGWHRRKRRNAGRSKP